MIANQRIFLNLLFCMFLMACLNQKKEKIASENQCILLDTLSIDEKIKILQLNLPMLATCPSCQQQYFDAFPNDFETFEAIFGYNNETAAPLYENSYDHINAYFQSLNISKSCIYKKTVRIAMNARWDADAVSLFQDFMVSIDLYRNKIISKEDLTLLVEVLESESDQDVEYFWYFYFDGEHPPKTIYPALDEFVKDQDSRVYELMHQGHERLIEGFIDDHGH